MNDFELLRHYAEGRSEEAFTELVKRYVDFVYSAAIRQVGGDVHLAQDVTQNVFADLARKAPSFSARVVLSGWLYTSTRFAAARIVRTERRRRARELESSTMQDATDNPPSEPSWEEVRTVLDSAMHALTERDRIAILLRYFENRPLAQVGARLGLREDAARMRIGRALEKLRALLAHRGITSTSAALATLLTSQTVGAAPAGMAAGVAGGALASAAEGGASLFTILNLMNMTKLKVGIVTAVLVAGMATPLAIQQHTNRALARENQGQLNELLRLNAENERLSNVLAQATAKSSPQAAPPTELLKLRGEVARLREDARELAGMKAARAQLAKDGPVDALLETLATRAALLRERIEQMPHLKIPELQFLTTKDWLYTAGDIKKLETEEDFRGALSDLRTRAKGAFSGKLQHALREFLKANDNVLPSDLSQLHPYFESPVDPSILDRYQLTRSGKLTEPNRGEMLIAERAAPADEEFDSHVQFGLRGMSSRSVSRSSELLEAATTSYANANNGLLPRDPAQLAAYLAQPVDPVRVQKYLNQRPANITTIEQLKAARR